MPAHPGIHLMLPWPAKVRLTRTRIWFALGVAAAVDVAQFALGPLGWTFLDEILDVLAMALISLALGFHPLLLPTFLLEVIPLVDMLPTWTACTALVVAMRRKSESSAQRSEVIEVEAEPVPPRPAQSPRSIAQSSTPDNS